MLQGIPPGGDLSAKLKFQDKHVEATADCFRTRVQFPPPPPIFSCKFKSLSLFFTPKKYLSDVFLYKSVQFDELL